MQLKSTRKKKKHLDPKILEDFHMYLMKSGVLNYHPQNKGQDSSQLGL